MRFQSCLFSGQKIHIVEILGHQHIYSLMSNLYFWSTFFILWLLKHKFINILKLTLLSSLFTNVTAFTDASVSTFCGASSLAKSPLKE